MTENIPKLTRPTRSLLVVSAVVAVLALSAVIGVRTFNKPAKTSKLPDLCNSRAFAEIGGPFSLINQDNVAVTEKTFLGKPALIFFGFTYCPDICPMALQTIRLALDEAKAAGGTKIEDIQPLLISIDPQRDTPSSLKTYVASNGFPERLVGLTGSLEQVTAAAKAFKVAFRKAIPQGSQPKDYVIDHTSIIYLLGRDGKMRTFFSGDPDPKEMGQCIAALSRDGL